MQAKAAWQGNLSLYTDSPIRINASFPAAIPEQRGAGHIFRLNGMQLPCSSALLQKSESTWRLGASCFPAGAREAAIRDKPLGALRLEDAQNHIQSCRSLVPPSHFHWRGRKEPCCRVPPFPQAPARVTRPPGKGRRKAMLPLTFHVHVPPQFLVQLALLLLQLQPLHPAGGENKSCVRPQGRDCSSPWAFSVGQISTPQSKRLKEVLCPGSLSLRGGRCIYGGW